MTVANAEYVLISAPTITRSADGGAVMSVSFERNGTPHRLWYSVEPAFADYLTADRSDGFLVALLHWAMHQGVNLQFTAPVSRRLFFTVTRFLMPMIQLAQPWKKAILIDAPLLDAPAQTAGACGTGLSCGVDSLTTVFEYLTDPAAPPPPYRLTHLTFFNVGSHGYGASYTDEGIDRLCRERLEQSRSCAERLGLPLVFVNSNVREYIDFGPFAHFVTLCNCSAALILQRLFSVYYVSSAYPLSKIQSDMGFDRLDPASIPLLSTDTLAFFLTGMNMTRVQKTEFISDHPVAHEFLNVCTAKSRNCSHCMKCLRTMLALDVIGKLGAFKQVFNVEHFVKNRSRIWAKARALNYNLNLMDEIWDEQASRRFRFPLSFWPWFLYYRITKTPRGFLRRLKRRTKKASARHAV